MTSTKKDPPSAVIAGRARHGLSGPVDGSNFTTNQNGCQAVIQNSAASGSDACKDHSIIRRPAAQVGKFTKKRGPVSTSDPFGEAKMLDTRAVVEFYTKAHLNGRGWMCCPLPGHSEKTPSFHAEATRWRCFGCNRGGRDAAAFVAEMFGIGQWDALKNLVRDFPQNFSEETRRRFDGHRLTAAEREQAARDAAERRRTADTEERFKAWVSDANKALSRCLLIANTALEHGTPDTWTPQECEAIKRKGEFEHYCDILETRDDAFIGILAMCGDTCVDVDVVKVKGDAAKADLLKIWEEVTRNVRRICE